MTTNLETIPCFCDRPTQWLAMAVDAEMVRLIGDCMPTSDRLRPITTRADLQKRIRCLSLARDLAEGAARAGLSQSFEGVPYEVIFDQVQAFIDVTSQFAEGGAIPEGDPRDLFPELASCD